MVLTELWHRSLCQCLSEVVSARLDFPMPVYYHGPPTPSSSLDRTSVEKENCNDCRQACGSLQSSTISSCHSEIWQKCVLISALSSRAFSPMCILMADGKDLSKTRLKQQMHTNTPQSASLVSIKALGWVTLRPAYHATRGESSPQNHPRRIFPFQSMAGVFARKI